MLEAWLIAARVALLPSPRSALPLLFLLAVGCSTQKPPPTVLPSCGILHRGQHISPACTQEAKRALEDPNTSELDQWRAKAVLECPVKGVISTNNERVSFECLYDLQRVSALSPPPWWALVLKPLSITLNWTLKEAFQLISPFLS
jgi:hypothetical protein